MRFELIGETVRVRSQRWHVDFSYDATLDQLKALCTWEGKPRYENLDEFITFITDWNYELLQPTAILETPTPTTMELRGRITLPNASLLPGTNIATFAMMSWIMCQHLMLTVECSLPGGKLGLANANPFLIQPETLRRMGPAS
ncbi:hypothetical protein FRX94_09135 [Corynebacterium canis]|uniref:Uncharacterized protein n=1 Tax=Corynebacterium canis TaxID=679663 RepID=A0A5C5UDR9_9CORY|nr:hypothetical protein [Corynebacterium canis]TWT24028.1 hypothetical protein FRX94_09135 [Corynebacterium canis]